MTLADTSRIIPAMLWVALMLVYLLGDVLRIFAGDHTPGEMDGKKAKPWMWTLAAGVMLLPIVMSVATLVVGDTALRWSTVLVAGFLIVFNLVGLPYPSTFDNTLIVVGLGINVLTIWQVWTI
jgi:ABC-type transport system involved in cytochrome c biogenesis permease component